MAISNTQEDVERSVYETIRLKLVQEGYAPDITTFDETPSGEKSYEEAIDQVVQSKGFSVGLYSTGSNYDKEQKKVPRIVLRDGRFANGDLGSQPNPFYKKSGQVYDALKAPSETYNYEFDIHLVSNKAKQNRIINAIIAQCLGSRRYIKYWNNPDKVFLLQQYNYYELPDTQFGIIEKVYSYQIPDIYISLDEVVKDNISPIKTITVLREDTDDIVIEVE